MAEILKPCFPSPQKEDRRDKLAAAIGKPTLFEMKRRAYIVLLWFVFAGGLLIGYAL